MALWFGFALLIFLFKCRRDDKADDAHDKADDGEHNSFHNAAPVTPAPKTRAFAVLSPSPPPAVDTPLPSTPPLAALPDRSPAPSQMMELSDVFSEVVSSSVAERKSRDLMRIKSSALNSVKQMVSGVCVICPRNECEGDGCGIRCWGPLEKEACGRCRREKHIHPAGSFNQLLPVARTSEYFGSRTMCLRFFALYEISSSDGRQLLSGCRRCLFPFEVWLLALFFA